MDIEGDDEYDVEEAKGSILRQKSVLYHVKWLGSPKKKDWTFEPFENFSEGGREKLYRFHAKHPNAPRDYRLPALLSATEQLPAKRPTAARSRLTLKVGCRHTSPRIDKGRQGAQRLEDCIPNKIFG